jgi:hypothetical protein
MILALFRRVLLHVANSLISLFSKEKRFTLAVRLSKVIAPALHQLSRNRFMPRLSIIPELPVDWLSTYREYTLIKILYSLTYRGIEFDPVVTVRGSEFLAGHTGGIIVSGHFSLNYIFIRWFFDTQPNLLSCVAVTDKKELYILGTSAFSEVIQPDARSLLRIKRKVRDGKYVGVEIDSFEPHDGWHKVNTSKRAVYINDGVIRFAQRLGIPIVFMGTTLDANDNIVITIAPSTNRTEVVLDEFGQFLGELCAQDHI